MKNKCLWSNQESSTEMTRKCTIIPFLNEQNRSILHLITFASESKIVVKFSTICLPVCCSGCVSLSKWPRHLHETGWLVGGVGAIPLPIYRAFSHIRTSRNAQRGPWRGYSHYLMVRSLWLETGFPHKLKLALAMTKVSISSWKELKAIEN